MAYNIPPGNPTAVWDSGNGGVTHDPWVSWQYHVDRGSLGGVDMTASAGTRIYSPVAGTVQRVPGSGGAGNVMKIVSSDGSGWVEVFQHLSPFNSTDAAHGATVSVGMSIARSGNSGGVGAHLHWHRENTYTGSDRFNPWNYFGVDAEVESTNYEEYDMSSGFIIRNASGVVNWYNAVTGKRRGLLAAEWAIWVAQAGGVASAVVTVAITDAQMIAIPVYT